MQSAGLQLFRDPPLDGPTNMARDEHLLHSDTRKPACLRLYQWTPATISLGYFQRFTAVAELPKPLCDLPIVRRATGGGAILHDREITYCLTLHEDLPLAARAPVELYRLVHKCWADAIAADGPALQLAPDEFAFPSPRTGPFFCFEKPGKTDLLLDGAKVLGSAQRRIPGRVLQHGSLLLDRRFAGHPGTHLDNPSESTVGGWIEAFIGKLAAALAMPVVEAAWTAEELADVAVRRRRYESDEWNQQR